MYRIDIAKEFGVTLGGRFKVDGPFSGEEFRDELLVPIYKSAVKNNECLLVSFDGCYGCPPSFVDEVFYEFGKKYGRPTFGHMIYIEHSDFPGLGEVIQDKICEGLR